MSSDSAAPGEARLDSWKEIAVHLERDVRTVQRWEKSEGLPVHRHVHGQRGTVFAYPSELDSWLRSRTQAAVPVAGRSWRRPASGFLILLTLVLGSAWLAGGLPGGDGTSSSANAQGARSRLVVLPLQVMGSDGIDETAGHGLHEQLITRLAGLAPARLRVIGRTSSLRYAAGDRSLAQIGSELRVEYALEGSQRQVGDGLEVTLRLVRAVEEDQVWSRTFLLAGSMPAEEEGRVAREVAEAVGRELFGMDPVLTSAATTHPEAHAAWLRGRYLWHKGNPNGFRASIEHYRAALEEDPNFVAAHVGLADAYNLLGRYGSLPAREVFPKARTAALRAIELDPKCAEAHAALGAVRFYYEWDFAGAAKSYQRALTLAPGVALSHHLYAHFLSCLGLHEEALVELRQAQALEPLWTVVVADAAWFHYRARRYEQAAEESRKALTIEPNLGGAVSCLVASLKHLGKTEEAWRVLRSSLDQNGLLAQIPGAADADAAAAMRSVDLWRRERIEELDVAGHVSGHALVFSLVGLDRQDDLLDALEQAIEDRDRVALLLKVHPNFDSVREEPRFMKVLEDVGFPKDPAGLLDTD